MLTNLLRNFELKCNQTEEEIKIYARFDIANRKRYHDFTQAEVLRPIGKETDLAFYNSNLFLFKQNYFC